MKGQLTLCTVQSCEDAVQHLLQIVYVTEGCFADWLGDVMAHYPLQNDSCIACVCAMLRLYSISCGKHSIHVSSLSKMQRLVVNNGRLCRSSAITSSITIASIAARSTVCCWLSHRQPYQHRLNVRDTCRVWCDIAASSIIEAEAANL